MAEPSLLDQLDMAQVSLAKVGDVETLKKNAKEALDNLRTDLIIRDRIEAALEDIDGRQDYELTPEIAREIDETVNEYGRVIVTKNGTIRVDGTEAFGLNITPADWRRSRVGQLQSMLSETYRNIKRWANQLQESFAERWEELTTTLKVLESRYESVSDRLDTVSFLRDECRSVELSPTLVRAVTKENERVPADLVKSVVKDINYFSSVMKFVNAEQMRIRNSTIRYFGNPKMKDISVLRMEIPKILNQRVKLEEGDLGKYIMMESQSLLEGYVLRAKAVDPTYIKREYTPNVDNTMLVNMFVECGFELVSAGHRDRQSEKIDTLSLGQLFELNGTVKDILGYIKNINDEYNPLDMNPNEIKDNLATLKANEEEPQRANQYASLCTDYQFRLNMVRSEVSSYMTILASHLLTIVSINLECYDA